MSPEPLGHKRQQDSLAEEITGRDWSSWYLIPRSPGEMNQLLTCPPTSHPEREGTKGFVTLQINSYIFSNSITFAV